MVLQDKQNNNDELINLVNKFIEASPRKRKNLIKDIESSADQLCDIAEKLFDQLDKTNLIKILMIGPMAGYCKF